MKTIIHENVTVGENGHLHFAGVDTVMLAEKYGTPAIFIDEDRVRARMREYKNALEAHFGAGSMPLFASKALSFKALYRIAADEGIGTDIVSPGELYTAVSAGFPMERAFFHGNNKTEADIRYAIESGLGYFVVDNMEELDTVSEIASEMGIRQKILLRITPDYRIKSPLLRKLAEISAIGAKHARFLSRTLCFRRLLLRILRRGA